MSFTGLLRLLGAALLAASLVTANIYPTTPYSETVFTAGRMNTVEWIDDGTDPSVQDMGPVKIDLYVAGETYVRTLADEIEPTSGSQDVWISPSWMHNGSDFHLRFICEDPPLIVYTADFTITGMTNLYPLGGPYIEDNATNPSVVYVTPMLTLVLPDATIVSALKPTPSTVSPSATAPPESTLADEGFHSRMRGQVQSGAAAASIRKRPTVNLEYLKFQSVFIFWPSLIGIAMAL